VRAFWEIFRLEFVGFVRSRALAILSLVSVAWMFAAPYVFRSDGTEAGAREMCVRFSLGGVAVLLAVSLLVASAGSLSRERAAKRLQLTMVRPVRLFALVGGKIAALSVIGSLVLALAASVEAVRQDPSRTCNSVFRPILPSPSEEAATMYAAYMADPETPPEVKRARKSVVMRLLTQRAIDHYQTVATNETVSWRFNAEGLRRRMATGCAGLAMRFRFTNMFEMRDEVRGSVLADGWRGSVSNITQAIVTIPLARCAPDGDPGVVRFCNAGTRSVMLRPRKDVELLAEADGFAANLLRAYLQLCGMLTALVSFGVFLGACLSRPVAVFVACVTLALSEMSPSVVEQYPDELETDRIDAVGLSLARLAAAVTHPVGSLRPLASLATDDCIEPRDVAGSLVLDVVVLPTLFALLAVMLLPCKQEDM